MLYIDPGEMSTPIPDNVKEILSQLPGSQQVTLRGYIATLREEIKDLNEELLSKADGDPHAHYHGHTKCTADHGHADAEHHHEHDNREKEPHDHHHDNHHHHDKDQKDHDDHDHKHHEHGHKHHDDHNHKHHQHDHDQHDHAHKHGHEDDKKGDEDMPAWKKNALKSDPSAAPFGGTWNAESSVSASKRKDNQMEE